MSDSTLPDSIAALTRVQDYHQRTKHRFEGYAAGPETLDWEAQPAAFRRFEGAPSLPLPRLSALKTHSALHKALQRPFVQLGQQAALPANLESLGAFLQLSLGLTAWKSFGPDRWAVRANPSSGNLHPIEAYVLVSGFPELADGLYHYEPEQHALECRARHPRAVEDAGPQLAILLTSVMWREAWKYGERAFRYCQLDTGHAMAALRYAAATLGWTLAEQLQLGSDTLSHLAGVDRLAEFPARRTLDTEREEAETLLAVGLDGQSPRRLAAQELQQRAAQAEWFGVASSIDPHPMYRWPVVGEIAEATRRTEGQHLPEPHPIHLPVAYPLAAEIGQQPIQQLLIQRRSAQRFEANHQMSEAGFRALLARLQPSNSLPWDTLSMPPHVALLLFISRVEGLEPGLYALPRHVHLLAALQPLIAHSCQLDPVPGFEGLLCLKRLEPLELKRLSRRLHCHQDIAGSACLSLGMLAEFDATLATQGASAYRDLYREAGLIGQLLYLEAEAQGLRGTGIGCFFDDPVHSLLGLDGSAWQSLYHFTIGLPVLDARIETTPAYTDDTTPSHSA